MENHKVGRVEPEYTMQAVVARTGVPADTIRSWERRHRFPQPGRDGSNQRVYAESDIQAILRLNQLRALGWSISNAIDQLRLLDIPPSTDSPASSISTADQDRGPSSSRSRTLQTSDELARMLDAFDGEAVRRSLNDALTFISVEDVCFSVLLPLATQAELDRTVSPYRSGFVRQILYSFYNQSSPDSGRATIMLAGVPGTHEESHLLCHAICASRAGYRTVLLGIDVALNQVEKGLKTIRPQAVMMTADSEDSAWTLTRWWHYMDRERPIKDWDGALLFSGSIFVEHPALANDTDAMYIPDRPDDARSVLEHALATADPPLRIVREP